MIKYRQLSVKINFKTNKYGGSNEEKGYLVSAQLINYKCYATRFMRLIEQFIDRNYYQCGCQLNHRHLRQCHQNIRDERYANSFSFFWLWWAADSERLC